MKLVSIETGNEIKMGSPAKTFRGEDVIVMGFSAPRHPGSTGKVYCQEVGASYQSQWFPSVIGAKIVE